MHAHWIKIETFMYSGVFRASYFLGMKTVWCVHL